MLKTELEMFCIDLLFVPNPFAHFESDWLVHLILLKFNRKTFEIFNHRFQLQYILCIDKFSLH